MKDELTVYRIIIGRHIDTVWPKLVIWGLEGGTVYPARGFWHGEREEATVIEVAMKSEAGARLLACYLRDTFGEEAVYFAQTGTADILYRNGG